MWGIKNTIEGTGPLLIKDGKICLLSRNNYNILVHSLEALGNPRLASLEGHQALVVALVDHDHVLYSGGYDRKVVAWDLDTYQQLGDAPVPGYINAMAVDNNEGVIYAGGENGFICALKLFTTV